MNPSILEISSSTTTSDSVFNAQKRKSVSLDLRHLINESVALLRREINVSLACARITHKSVDKHLIRYSTTSGQSISLRPDKA